MRLAGAGAHASPPRRSGPTCPASGKPTSVHLERFPEERGEWINERLGREWDRLLEVRGEVSRALEAARQRGRDRQGLDAVVYASRVRPRSSGGRCSRPRARALLPTLFNVSGRASSTARGARGRRTVYESQDIPGLTVGCCRRRIWAGGSASAAGRGARASGKTPEHPTLCERCVPVVRARCPARDRLAGRDVRVAVVLVLDQLTKAVALRRLAARACPSAVVDGFFSLTLVMNPGLAFGMLLVHADRRGAGSWPRSRWSRSPCWPASALRLLPSGGWTTRARARAHLRRRGRATSSTARRFGAVVDFLDFYWRDYHWPAFNVADSAITRGRRAARRPDHLARLPAP